MAVEPETIDGAAVEEHEQDGGRTYVAPSGEVAVVSAASSAAVRDRGGLSVEDVVARVEKVREIAARVMKENVHYGVIPGVQKPSLFKPGAEVLCVTFELDPETTIEREHHDQDGHLDVVAKTTLYHIPSGMRVAGGIGSCSTRETRYAMRQGARTCPECGSDAIIRGKKEYGGGWLCYGKKGGCGAKWTDDDEQAHAFENTDTARVARPREELADAYNTVRKMASKRCLASRTPVLFWTARGASRGHMESLYACFQKTSQPVYLPGPDGVPRRVLGVSREAGRQVLGIELADGTRIRATAEHRFPTASGLRRADELKAGDSLRRARLRVTAGTADCDLGWLAGLYIADGCRITETALSLNLNRTSKAGAAERVVAVAERLGASTSVKDDHENGRDVFVYGPSVAGIIDQFVDGEGSYGRHFSRWVWRQGEDFVRSMLNGYLAGDGTHEQRDGRIQRKYLLRFTGRNRELARDLRTAAAILGLRIDLRRTRRKGLDAPVFDGWLSFDEPAYNGKALEGVVSVTPETRPAVVYDVEVDGDHLFCLADGIVTHNSLIDAILRGTAASEIYTQDVEDFAPTAAPQPTRQEGPPPMTVPRSWAKVNELAGQYDVDLHWPEWVRQASVALFGEGDSKKLAKEQRQVVLQKAAGAVVALFDIHPPSVFPPPETAEVRRAWASVLDGVELQGPPDDVGAPESAGEAGADSEPGETAGEAEAGAGTAGDGFADAVAEAERDAAAVAFGEEA